MEVNISTQELADIYASLVAPVLQEMVAPELKSPPVKAGISRHAELAAGIVAAFGAFDLGVEAVGVVEGPQVTRIKLQPSSGVKVVSLANRAADLQIALALDERPLIKPEEDLSSSICRARIGQRYFFWII